MRLLILGATGRTGQKVVEQALERGHSVTAIVRRPSMEGARNLHVVTADPCNPEQILPAMREQNAVISCLGQRGGSDPRFVSTAATATLEAMRRAEVKRFVIVSGALLYPTRNPVVLVMKKTLAERLNDARAAEQTVVESAARWTIVRPPHLREGTGKGYRMDTAARPSLSWSLQFHDLAACLLDVAESEAFVGKVVGVASY